MSSSLCCFLLSSEMSVVWVVDFWPGPPVFLSFSLLISISVFSAFVLGGVLNIASQTLCCVFRFAVVFSPKCLLSEATFHEQHLLLFRGHVRVWDLVKRKSTHSPSALEPQVEQLDIPGTLF